MRGLKISQHPGEEFLFSCGHKGVLPELGIGNDFAIWSKQPNRLRGGSWYCRACQVAQVRGAGSSGLRGWAKHILLTLRRVAKIHGYTEAKIAIDELVSLRLGSLYCSDGCGQKLKWCIDGSFRNPHLHHDHKTGQVYGFITMNCNTTEGSFSKIENKRKWLEYHFPDIVGGLRHEA